MERRQRRYPCSYEVLETGGFDQVELLATVTKVDDRISIHCLRRVLFEHQADALGFPVEKMFIPKSASDAEYENILLEVLKRHRVDGFLSVLSGDIFLEDLRRYREKLLIKVGMNGLFPLWKRDTKKLAQTFIDLGFKAVITSIDSNVLGKNSLLEETTLSSFYQTYLIMLTIAEKIVNFTRLLMAARYSVSGASSKREKPC